MMILTDDADILAHLSTCNAQDEPVMVPVTFILRYACDSVDFGYCHSEDNSEWLANIIRKKSQDSGMGYLIESIIERGWSPDSAIGFNATGCITEGHHRFAAAVLLGLDYVPITAGGKDDYTISLDNGEYISGYDIWGVPAHPIEVEF